jgi:predicted metal-dependent hydrolase
MSAFEFKQGPYNFDCKLKRERRKSISLRIMPDLSVMIKAPYLVSQSYIIELITKKAAWIAAKQALIQNKVKIQEQRFAQGSTCYYLGAAYTLHYKEAEHDAIYLDANTLYLHHQDPSMSHGILTNWYQIQAQALFSERMHQCYKAMHHLTIPAPKQIRIKSLKSRWGSCSSSQNISLNLDLIQYPIECIDYVIFHELCHLRELNHGPRFYALMDEVMADWQRHRQNLRKLHRMMPSLG